jgi:transposase
MQKSPANPHHHCVSQYGAYELRFRGRAGTSIKLLTFDGQGYWLCQKRLSKGRFRWWPGKAESKSAHLLAHELQVLICGGDPAGAKVPPAWRQIGTHSVHSDDLTI